jgi:hypothetical protein
MQSECGCGSGVSIVVTGGRRSLGRALASAAPLHPSRGSGSGVSILRFDLRRILGYALASAALLFTFACGGSEEAAPAPKSAPASAASAPASAPGESLAAALDGSCDGAEPLGPAEAYKHLIRAKENTLGIVRVRSNGRFVAGEDENVLGEVKSGALLHAQGPLKNADYGKSKAYAVVVRDPKGKLCRGYVSTLYVDLVKAGAGE